MCGIAGIIHRDGLGDIGSEMTRMLQSMKHRGPDSSGFALYGRPDDLFVMRIKLADPNEKRDFGWGDRLERHRNEIEHRLAKIGAMVDVIHGDQEYAYRVTFRYSGDLKPLADYVEDVPGCEVLSLGHSLEIIKDLSDAESVAQRYNLPGFTGTYWAYPFSDIAVVHNGQLTNYHMWRRRLERKGHRFQSECDSEIIAVYLAQKMDDGLSLETAMKQSLDELDGVFTYLVVTADALGVAKDEMAAKPLVLYESPGLVALASEEVAIRAVIGHEIDTYDPYEREVLVWHR
jgi:methylamine---glutamate N-methyltransferase subunit A